MFTSTALAADYLHIRIVDMQGHQLADGDVRAQSPTKLFSHLRSGSIQIEISDVHQHIMQFSGDLDADGQSDCTIRETRKTKQKTTRYKSFIVIKEWGPSSRTIPCINEEDAQTKFNTAISLGRKRDEVYVLRFSFAEGSCAVEVLSWAYAETRLR